MNGFLDGDDLVFLERESYIFVVCVDGYLQYAFYFLVVGAAIWASSWAGKIKTKKKDCILSFLTAFLSNLDSN